MLKKIVSICLVVVVSSIVARAQFNPSSSAAILESKTDTIAVTPNKEMSVVLHNEAYDRYLKKIQSKQRNTIIFKNTGLAFTQTAYSNWAPGGTNSFSIRATTYFEHQYVAPIFNIKTIFDAAYGMQSANNKIQKNEDWWRVIVTPSWRIAPKWSLTASSELRTQFSHTFQALTDTTSRLTSTAFAPATLTASVGLSYAPPKGKLNIYLAPITGSMVMVLNDELAQVPGFAGMKEVGRKFQPSFGALLRITYGETFAKKKITYNTKFESFWNYNSTPTVWWENKLNFKFTNLLWLNFYVLAVYNDQMATPYNPKIENTNFFNILQINESIGFGLMFNFASQKPPTPADNPYTKPTPKKRKK